MSGFFGIFRPQGGPVDLEAFEQMRKATEREGFDGLETHVEEKIAMGHLMLRVSPESKYDKQPLKSDCGNYLLVGHFRLDYRDELGDKLGLSQSELEHTPDSQLVMISFQKWNEKCVNHIEGDWAFAIYNIQHNSIFLGKDQTGNSALFYFWNKNYFYFSSELNVILSINSINFTTDKVQLGRLSLHALGLSDGMTLFKDIFILKNSEYLFLDDKYVINNLTYSSLDGVIKVNYKFEEDYVFELFSIYQQAVKARVYEKKQGLLLSSGLDSTSVAYLASKQLKVKDRTLYTFTSYPEYQYNLSGYRVNQIDESIKVESFVSCHDNIVSEYLNFPKTNFKEVFEKSTMTDAHFPIYTINSFWIHGILSRAKCIDVKSIFTGQMGNYTISWYGPFELTKLILKLKLGRIFDDFWRVELFKKGIFFKQYFKIVYSEIIGWFFYIIKYSFLQQKLKSPFFIKSGFVVKKHWVDKIKHTNFLPSISYYRLFDSRKIRKALIARTLSNSGNHWFALGHEYGMVVLDPTADLRLLNYSFSIPELLFTKYANKKYLFHELMMDYLPSDILNAEFKIPQSADIADRLANDKLFVDEISSLKFTEQDRKFFEVQEFKNYLEIILNNRKNLFIRRGYSNMLFYKLSLKYFLGKYS